MEKIKSKKIDQLTAKKYAEGVNKITKKYVEGSDKISKRIDSLASIIASDGETTSYVLNLASNATSSKSTLSIASFTQSLDPSIDIPFGVKPIINLEDFSGWNYYITISSSANNNKFYYTDDTGNLTKYTITLDSGYYSVLDLNNTIQYGLMANGDPSTLITITADNATQKVRVSIDRAGYLVYLPAGTFYSIIGYNLNDKIPTAGTLTTGAYNELAPNVADFAALTTILLHTDIAAGSNSYNDGKLSDVLTSIPLNVKPGSLINYKPFFPLKLPIIQGVGSSIESIRVYLTDEENNSINVTGSPFYVRIKISWGPEIVK